MKIIHSCTSLSYSGLERYVVDLTAWQKSQGLDVELFCREGSDLARAAAAAGVPLWTIPRDAAVGPALWLAMRAGWAQRFIMAARSAAKQQAGETERGLITLHLHHAGELRFHWPWLNDRRLAKKILQFHLWITHSKRNLFHRWLYKGVDEVWCSSESALSQLRGLLPVAPTCLRVVPYGREVARLRALPRDQCRTEVRARYGIAEDAVVAVTVARFEPIKGVAELLEGFATAGPRFPQGHLLVVGGPSPENEEAHLYAEALKSRYESLPAELRARVHFTGFLSDADRVMAASDVYVLPSYEECMSLALLDALILGLPAIGTDQGGTPSVVLTGKTGIIVPARDAAALGAALEAMFARPVQRELMAKGARERSAAFDRDAIFASILKRYRE